MDSIQYPEDMYSYSNCENFRDLAIARTFVFLLASAITVVLAVVLGKRGHTLALAFLSFFCFLLFVAGAVDWAHYKTTLCVCNSRPPPFEPWALAFLLMAIAFLVGQNLLTAFILSVLPFVAFIILAVASIKFGGHTTSLIPNHASFLRSGTAGTVGTVGSWFLILATISLIVYAIARIFSRPARMFALYSIFACFVIFPMAWQTLARSRFAHHFHTWCDGNFIAKVILGLLFPLAAVAGFLAIITLVHRNSRRVASHMSSSSSADEAAPVKTESVTRLGTAPVPVSGEATAPTSVPGTRQSTTVEPAPAPAPVTRQGTSAAAPAPAPVTRQGTSATAPAPASRQSTAAPAPATRQGTATVPPPA